jgi:hypothetical protein
MKEIMNSTSKTPHSMTAQELQFVCKSLSQALDAIPLPKLGNDARLYRVRTAISRHLLTLTQIWTKVARREIKIRGLKKV